MVDIDFNKLNDEELQWLSATAYKEVALRKQKAREKDWNSLIEEIDEYCKKYGEITIVEYGDKFVLEFPIRCNCIGEINLENED
jgi:hypothetical protein